MSNEKIKSILKEILSELEIKVYLASLESPLTIQELAKKAGLNRSGTYRIVENLISKGLLSRELKSHGQKIVAEHPKKVLQLLSNSQRKLRRKELELQDLLPELLAEYNQDFIKPTVKYYEGIVGFKNIMNRMIEVLEKQNLLEYKIWAPTDKFLQTVEVYCPKVKKKRIGLKVQMKLITSESHLAQKRQKGVDKKELRQRKILPKKFSFESIFILFGSQVVILDLEENIIGLIIENSKISETLNNFFNFIWEKI